MCKYCNDTFIENEPIIDGDFVCDIIEKYNDEYCLCSYSDYEYKAKINYCPICGRELNEKARTE